jgi:hypothetical protein
VGTADDENAARDLVGRPRRNPPIRVDRLGFESLHIKTSAIVHCTAHKDATSRDGRAKAPDREIVEVSRDDDVLVSLRVPNRKDALQDVYAVGVGPLLLAARICRGYVEAIYFYMATSDLLSGKDLNATDRLERVKADVSQTLHSAVIPDGAFFWQSKESEIADSVVGRDLKSVATLAERESLACS